MLNASHSPLLCDIVGHAIAKPDKIALVSGDRHIPYSQLAANIEAAARWLHSLGLNPGDYILLSAQKEVEFVYLYFAAHLLGIVNVVVDSAAPRERLDYIINVVKPAILFGNNLDIDGYRCMPFTAFEANAVCDSQWVLPDITADAVADVMFTTGTTGAPKGVCLTHANVAASAANTNGFIGNGPDDIEALALPLSHSFGLGRLRCTLTAGATLILVSNFANLKSFFNVLETGHVTGFGMVPAVWQYIKRLSGKRIAKFAEQLRYIEIGSAALPIEDKRLLMEIFPHTRLCMHYGLTEASRAMFSEFHTNAANLETIGRPASSKVEAIVVDGVGEPVEDGIDGEICVRGNMVTHSYFLTADNVAAFYGNWFRTGDWGHRDKDGNFYLTGRKKELINIGGEKVSPVTIEEAIKSLGIIDCACIAVPDPNGVLGEVPKAFLQKGNCTLTIEDVKERLKSLLPPNEIPVLWEWINKIPRTASGKIQRLNLKQ
ncbi:MAG: acyl--CoA ligase [Muribaculaceae bacterium]|nr:acyl--CoA ligase [Muribaculaceae bacterium]